MTRYDRGMHPRTERRAPLRLAILGLGTVGRAVAERLIDPAWRERVTARGLVAPDLVAIGVREPERPRGVSLPAEVRLTSDLDALAVAPDVDVLVELIGGTEDAARVVGRALAAGRSVVTANKALLAESGADLETAARGSGAALRFEAAVGGGIPLLRPLVEDLAPDRVESVRGIVNGTTNEILTRMADGGLPYADVLAQAQAAGYAESDPRADVEGHDACAKLVILSRLAFGAWASPGEVRLAVPIGGEMHPGITGITSTHLARAADLGLAVKLVARATRLPSGDLSGAVTPMAVRRTAPIGSTDGVTNIVEIGASPLGRVSFRGPGAGGPATSSAVLADVLALSQGSGSTWGSLPPAGRTGMQDDLGDEQAWFVVLDRPPFSGPPTGLAEIAVVSGDNALVTRPMRIEELAARLIDAGGMTAILPLLPDA
jgi:homoserine dehydrogenase